MKLKILLIAIFLLSLLFTRFYNIEKTARFTEDESGFMVRVHQIYVERKITLVGQINDLGTKVFSSLTVYLLLPFAAIGKFDPTSVFVGAAFYGVLTAILLIYLSLKISKSKTIFLLSAAFILIWFPFVQLGRWAWNPNFIPLWICLGILLYLKEKPIYLLFSGICFGLSIHQHYYAIFAIGIFTLLVSLKYLFKKRFLNAFLINFGAGLAILPFLIFDLRHKPGLFLLGAANQANQAVKNQFTTNLISYTSEVIRYFTQLQILIVPFLILFILLVILDIKHKSKSLIFLIPCIFQIIFISIVAPFFIHYFFVCLVFFFVWLIYPRKKVSSFLSILLIIILLVGSSATLKNLITTPPVEPNLTDVKGITKLIENEINERDLKNVNIAVLGSSDKNTYGKKYRDLILVDTPIHLKTVDEYPITDNLFVISTSTKEEVLKDKAVELNSFRSGIVKNMWTVDNWKVYLLNKK